jgi:hypothetical protein
VTTARLSRSSSGSCRSRCRRVCTHESTRCFTAFREHGGSGTTMSVVRETTVTLGTARRSTCSQRSKSCSRTSDATSRNGSNP